MRKGVAWHSVITVMSYEHERVWQDVDTELQKYQCVFRSYKVDCCLLIRKIEVCTKACTPIRAWLRNTIPAPVPVIVYKSVGKVHESVSRNERQ